MKNIIILFSAVLFLNTTNTIAKPTELIKKDVRRQVNYVLATSEINETGTVTVQFFVFNKQIRVQKIEGKNYRLNQMVKKCLEQNGLNKKGLNGYYSIVIKLKDASEKTLTFKEKNKLHDLMAINYSELRKLNIE
jgi:hypothetical protein